MLVTLIAWLSLACLHAQTAGPPGTISNNLGVYLRYAGAFGDLDSDGRTDFAIAHAEGQVSGLYRYRVEILLSTQLGAHFDIESGPAGGLQIRLVDVEGDRDLDLVVTSKFGGQQVGSWINHGDGRFTRGSADRYSPTDSEGPAQLSISPDQPNRPLVIATCAGAWTAEAPTSCAPLLSNPKLPFPVAANGALAPLRPGNPFRAPPAC